MAICKIRIYFMRSCFGYFPLRTGVLMIAAVEIVYGLYEIIDFGWRVYDDLHSEKYTSSNEHNSTMKTKQFGGHHAHTNVSTNHSHIKNAHGPLYNEASFAMIVIGIINLILNILLLYVALMNKYKWRIVIFVAASWLFVIAFLDLVSIFVLIGLHLFIEMAISLVVFFVDVFFCYVILCYFKFVTLVCERGLDEFNVSYFSENQGNDNGGIQLGIPTDEQPILDDQDDIVT